MRQCTKCQEMKSETDFYDRKDGYVPKVCKSCKKIIANNYYNNNREKCVNRKRIYRSNNLDKVKNSASKSYFKYHKKRRKEVSEYRKNNVLRVRELSKKYQQQRKLATPKWLTQDQKLEIEWFYETAVELQWLSEDKLEVDHIIPLRGLSICGLHVPWNLQILPRSWNRKKSRDEKQEVIYRNI